MYNTQLLAISVDHVYAHNVFAASLGTLPYPLLSDWHKNTVKKYGVFNHEQELAKRSVFLVDQGGIIRYKNTTFDANKPNQYQEVFSQCKQLSL